MNFDPFRDPEPFGPPRDKPTIKSVCRVTALGPNRMVSGPEGFETVLMIVMETPESNFEMSIDARSANFLAGAIPTYVTHRSIPFDQYVIEIEKFAKLAGATDPGEPYCDAEAWRDAFNNGLSPAEAWAEEVSAMAGMRG